MSLGSLINPICGRVSRILILAVLVNSTVPVIQASIDPEQENVEQLESTPVDSVEIQTFRDTLAGIESDQGAYAQALTEYLISLGQALQQQGRHTEAADVFKRGVHLARVNHGLYSAEQIPFIQGEISSNLAVGDLVEADPATTISPRNPTALAGQR